MVLRDLLSVYHHGQIGKQVFARSARLESEVVDELR